MPPNRKKVRIKVETQGKQMPIGPIDPSLHTPAAAASEKTSTVAGKTFTAKKEHYPTQAELRKFCINVIGHNLMKDLQKAEKTRKMHQKELGI